MVQGAMRDDLYPELYRVEEHHWWHRQKRQVTHQLIKQYCQKQGRVLDVGCGAGKILEELQTLGWQVEGVDAAPAKAQTQRRSLKIKTANLQTQPLPYSRNYFDLVICLDTLEHMSDDQRLAREMARVTKPKGVIIISVPAYQWLFSYWDKMLGHFRRYNQKTLLKAIPKKLLRRIFVSYFFSFLLLPAVLIRLIKIVVRQKQQSDFTTDPLPVLTHGFVGFLGNLELLWLKKFSIPFGLSLVGVFAKK
jgi:ubiquinone/menaquinone biosynthesis C-methylase UbiE